MSRAWWESRERSERDIGEEATGDERTRRESRERSERDIGESGSSRASRDGWSRRRFLEAAGAAGAVALAGCSGDPDDGGTATPTATASPTATATATPTPSLRYTGTLGFESMLEATPAHPELEPSAYVWARHVDVAGVLSNVDDRTIAGRLRGGWLGAGPPRYAESDAFELVHVQSMGLPNVTFGYGDFSRSTAVDGMLADDWARTETDRERFDVLERGSYSTAVGDAVWLVMRTAGTDAIDGVIDAVRTDPLTDYLDDVDAEAMDKAAAEDGGYHVLERSESAGYAAGIAVEYAPHRTPVGVMQYTADRASPAWERVETEFEERIAGEVRRSAFGEEFA